MSDFETVDPLRGLFISGTDTHVGKTFVTAALVQILHHRGVMAAPYKPVVSGGTLPPGGTAIWEDVEHLYAAAGGRFPRETIAPQRFLAPLAPPFAAREEGKTVDESRLISGAHVLALCADIVLVEGAGGLLSPVSDSWNNATLAEELELPLLIVGRLGLGTLNHTLLTVEAAERRGLTVAGVILTEDQIRPDDLSTRTNPQELSRLMKVPLLAVVPHTPVGTPESLENVHWDQIIDISPRGDS